MEFIDGFLSVMNSRHLGSLLAILIISLSLIASVSLAIWAVWKWTEQP